MIAPSLLLSPTESRTPSGTVAPVLSATVTTEAGRYGVGWRIPEDAWVTLPSFGGDATAGTLLVRLSVTDTSGTKTFIGWAFPRLQALATEVLTAYDGTNVHTTTATLPVNTPLTLAMTWSGAVLRIYVDGAKVYEATTRAVAQSGTTLALGGLSETAQNGPALYEGALAYTGIALTDQEVATLSTMGEAWTWDSVQADPPISQPITTPILRIGSSHIGPLRAGKA